MSEHWELYQCTMGNNRAFILYDEGVAETISSTPHQTALKIRAGFKTPNTDGLPTEAEFNALCDLEDALTDAIEGLGGVYVGRITVGGYRYFHSFCDARDHDIDAALKAVSRDSGYALSKIIEKDTAKLAYWDDLYPTEDDRQVMQNMKVQAALLESGDNHGIARDVDHWAYFPSRFSAEAMRQWLEKSDYEVTACGANEEDGEWPFVVKFRHHGTMELAAISNRTIALARYADGLDGYYDGWETSVETGDVG